MHVRVRLFGKPEAIVVVESKLTKIEKFRRILKDKFDVSPKLQRLLYGGKLLEDGYTFHDYNIKLNDVIQLMVRIQPEESPQREKLETNEKEDAGKKNDDKKVVYKDADSVLYTIGDLIDIRYKEQGAWFEGKIIRIVYDPDATTTSDKNGSEEMGTNTSSQETKPNFDKESDVENKPPEMANGENSKPKKGIARYLCKSPKSKRKLGKSEQIMETDVNLLYQVQLDGDDEDSKLYCKLKDIRPRARTVIETKDLKIGQKVMVNYNIEVPQEKGYWYDFKIGEIQKLRTNFELKGTLYLGPDAVPQNDTRIWVHDKIYAIEDVVPLALRTEVYNKLLTTPLEKRSQPLNCLTCRDLEDSQCRDCGCFLCEGKEFPEKIILCDECNRGYHMVCLTPPLTEVPDEDWYCPSCKRDTNDVIAPGAAKQTKKASTKSNRDWGRGMACAGKTKTCAMPPNHFGPIPGIEVGMCWRFRIQLSESGVHRPPVSGIHGRDVEGAYSIVLSGGYEDDVDHGYEFTYTGSGGRDLSGNKRTAGQSCDQRLTRENKALARNCAVKEISEEGGDAGDNWRSGKPVRVARSYKMLKHFPKYAPKEGLRYDGIYKVVKYYPEKGLSGYRVWKYLFRRDDPSPAPWEPSAKEFPIVFPDGYLEAEAEKRAQKEKITKGPKGKDSKKRALRESNHSEDSEGKDSPPPKKQKENEDQPKKRGRPKNKSPAASPKAAKSKGSIANSFTKSPKKQGKSLEESALTQEERRAITADTLNAKLWGECLEVCEGQGRKGFVEHVTQVFLCIICQDVAVAPATTPCLHNFCMACLKQAMKATGSRACPCCRYSLAKYEPEPNEQLKAALRAILPGYDAGKK